MWFILFPVAAHAIAFASPQATLYSHKTVDSLTLPRPTTSPFSSRNRHDLLLRRDNNNDANTISAVEASVCGFFGGSMESRLACNYPNECVFHASDSQFPGMMGCCPTSSTTTPCTFFSTCYNSADISSAPSLLSRTTDPFVLLCTYDEGTHCVTRTWPDLNVADYDCTDVAASRAETMYTAGSLTDVTVDGQGFFTETLSISWVGDAVLLSLRNLAASTTSDSSTSTSTTTTSTTAASTQTSASSNGQSSPKDGASTGTIVGAVVGSVIGLIVILVAGWFIWRRRKNRDVVQPLGPAKEEAYDKQHELHAVHTAGRVELMPEREFVELPSGDPRYELE